VNVNLREGRVRTWDDWRDRLASAARGAASEVAKKVLALLLDRPEAIPEPLKGELSRVVVGIDRCGDEELYTRLLKLKDALRELSSALT